MSKFVKKMQLLLLWQENFCNFVCIIYTRLRYGDYFDKETYGRILNLSEYVFL